MSIRCNFQEDRLRYRPYMLQGPDEAFTPVTHESISPVPLRVWGVGRVKMRGCDQFLAAVPVIAVNGVTLSVISVSPGSLDGKRYKAAYAQHSLRLILCCHRITTGRSGRRNTKSTKMSEFQINDADFASLKGKVVVLTGGSSGIGLATTQLLLAHGCYVFSGDLTPSPVEDPALTHLRTDVSSWQDLLALFKAATSKHSRVDHVFANAGMGSRANYFESKFDADGNLEEPSFTVYDVMLRGVINTIYLGLHQMRTQSPPGGSLLITASASSFQRFGVVDYATAKHGVLGFMRGLVPHLQDPAIPIRINALAPSWTLTGIVPKTFVESVGGKVQGPEVVARNVACMFVDEQRQGQLVYSAEGRFFEIDEAVLLPAVKAIMGSLDDEGAVQDFLKRNRERRAANEGGS
nr:putative oxidoreductase ykvo [Quercus suber]